MPPPATEATQPADAATPARLDVRGLLCPLPVLLTAREIAKLRPGGRLVVEGDDHGILEDLPAWCAASGHRLVEIAEVEAAPEPVSNARVLIRAVVEKAAG